MQAGKADRKRRESDRYAASREVQAGNVENIDMRLPARSGQMISDSTGWGKERYTPLRVMQAVKCR